MKLCLFYRWGDQRTERLINLSHVCACAQSLSRVQLFATPWTVAHQAPLSMGILQARILEWVAMPSLQGDRPNPGIEPKSPALRADSLPSESPGKNTGVGCHALLQGIFLTQESNQASCMAGGFVTSWAIWETQIYFHLSNNMWNCVCFTDEGTKGLRG